MICNFRFRDKNRFNLLKFPSQFFFVYTGIKVESVHLPATRNRNIISRVNFLFDIEKGNKINIEVISPGNKHTKFYIFFF